ncbi:MAG: hypothetical protein ACO3P1_13915 [Pseudomonadales bacterium]
MVHRQADQTLSPLEKALAINLDARRYGTFAEIGAGQEVVRWFFQAGGASGTIAKSISAYDMTVSDAIYGECERYVCRERLDSMLEYEYELNLNRLSSTRGDTTAFFAFANTVAARNFQGTNEAHGWMGIRFQSHPRDELSQIILHVRMWDTDHAAQQEALGIVGVNLVYGAFFHYAEPERLIESLLDRLSISRIEIDLIEFSGIEFRRVDNRVMALRLVQLGLTDAAMLASDGRVLQPSEVLRRKAVIVERGRFRPVTRVNMAMLDAARRQLADDQGIDAEDSVMLLEMTMRTLMASGQVDLRDFLGRAEVVAATGHTVLISNYFEYHRLAAYLARYTDREVAIVMGVPSLPELFNDHYYVDLLGGTLEGFGRLFKNAVRIMVYPMRDGQQLVSAPDFRPQGALGLLYQFLLERGSVVPLRYYDENVLHIRSDEVLELIREGDPAWEDMVPAPVAAAIRRRGLFGFRPDRGIS